MSDLQSGVQLNTEQFVDFASLYFLNDLKLPQGSDRTPIKLTGAPGAAKSASAQRVADEMAKELGEPVTLVDWRLATFGVEDIRGMFNVNNTEFTSYIPPVSFPNEERHGKYGILFMDECDHASDAVDKIMMQGCYDKVFADHKLPDGWVILLAANRQKDRAAVRRITNAALDNRLVHVEMMVDDQCWLKWAAADGVNPIIQAYIKFCPDKLHQYPDGIPKGVTAYSTPRSLVRAGRILDMNLPADLEHAGLVGAVGEGIAGEIAGVAKVIRTMPDIEAVLKNPMGSPLVDDPSTVYALSTLLARKVDGSNFQNAIIYLSRTNADYAVVMVQQATERDPTLKSTKAYIDFKIANADSFNE